jgi:PAS domain S-box-containing protein
MTTVVDKRNNPEAVESVTTSADSVEVIRVLHIDDEEQQQMFLKIFVENDPSIKVTSAHRAQDVIDLIQTGAYDCLISDYDMPDMDGITLAKRVRETSQIPIIIYTGRGSEEVAERAFEAGIDDYIRKEMQPAHYQVLSKRIRQAVERRRINESYRNLFENASDAIYIHTPEGRLLDVNEVACKRLGYAKEELMKMTLSQFVKPLTIGYDENATIVKREGHAVFESTNLTSRGDLIPVEVSARVIKYMGVEAILSFSRDISDRKRIDAEMIRKLEILHRHAAKLVKMSSRSEVTECSFNIIEELLGFTDGCIGVVEGDHLKFVYAKNVAADLIPDLSLDGRGITVRAVRTGKTQLINDTRDDPDFVKDKEDGPELLSELDVPIIIDGSVMAVINLEDERPNLFTEENRKILELLAEHIASAFNRIEQMDAIKGSEEKYRGLIESSHDAVIVAQGNRIVFVNQNTVKLLGGGKASDLVGLDATLILDDGEKQRITNMTLSRQAGNPELGTYSSRLVARDGRVIPVEVAASVIDYVGAPAVLAFIRDISDKVRYQEGIEALHRHAAMISAVTNRNQIFEMTMDAVESVIGFHNLAFLELRDVGLVSVGNRGSNRLEISLPLDGKGVTVRAARERRTMLVPDTKIDPDFIRGTTDSKSELAVPILNDGRVFGVINLESNDLNAFDEIDKKLLETLVEHVSSALLRLDQLMELRASESRYRILVENSNDSIIVIRDARIIYANTVAAKLRGYERPEDLVGHEAVEFMPEEDRPLIGDRMISRQRGEPQPDRYYLRLLRRDGSVIDVETVASLIEYEGKQAVLSIARDVSDLKRLEERMEVLHRHAAQLVSAKSVDEVSEATMNAITSLMGFDLVSILVNEKGSLRSIRNAGNSVINWSIPIGGKGITAKAARERRTILINDLRGDQDFLLGSTKSLSELATPVMVSGEPAAVLNIESTRLNAFTENDARVLETIALHVASALEQIALDATLRNCGLLSAH